MFISSLKIFSLIGSYLYKNYFKLIFQLCLRVVNVTKILHFNTNKYYKIIKIIQFTTHFLKRSLRMIPLILQLIFQNVPPSLYNTPNQSPIHPKFSCTFVTFFFNGRDIQGLKKKVIKVQEKFYPSYLKLYSKNNTFFLTGEIYRD